MQIHRGWRALVIALAVTVVGVVAAVSCRDATTTDTEPRPNDAATTQLGHRPDSTWAEIARSRSAAAIQSRDTFAWVGAAHNKAIDDFRTQLRKPQAIGNTCRFLISFIADSLRLPREKRHLWTSSGQQAAHDAVRDTHLCRSLMALHRGGPRIVALASRVVPQDVSSIAAQLYNEMGAAVSQATSASDLAMRMAPIITRAADLDTIEQQSLAIAASVAQSSYLYWEANFAGFTSDVSAKYGPCLSEYGGAGLSSDDAIANCTDGNWGEVRSPWRHPTGGPRVSLTSFGSSSCGYGLASDFKAMALADLGGAWNGFWKGLVGGPAGMAEGALIGGSGASIGIGLGIALSIAYCMMVT